MIVSVIVYLAAGTWIFVVLLNRVVMHLRNRWIKREVFLLKGVVLILGSAWLGYALPTWPWIIAPVLVLSLALAWEGWHAILRRRCRREPAAQWIARPCSLLRPFTTTDIVETRYVIRLARWRGPPFRVAHISDIHMTRKLPLEYYRTVMKQVADARPDLLFVTGDFVSSLKYVPRLVEVLRPVGVRGNFAVLGNHDYWAGSEAIAAALRQVGFTLVGQAAVPVSIAGHSLIVAGCEDPVGPHRWHAPARAPDQPLLVLAHTADNVFKIMRDGGDAVFAGHYHGGQFRLPGWGSCVVPSRYGRRFDHGHYVLANTHLFVSAGIGVDQPPFRIYCPPDIFLIDCQGD